MIVVDTGPLYAAADTGDVHHAACAAVFRDPPDRLVVPVSVVVETSFLIERHLGPSAEANFLASLAPAGVLVEQLGHDDLVRMAELVQTYADMPLGAVDASVVAIAERIGATTILTVDQRHFSVVRYFYDYAGDDPITTGDQRYVPAVKVRAWVSRPRTPEHERQTAIVPPRRRICATRWSTAA